MSCKIQYDNKEITLSRDVNVFDEPRIHNSQDFNAADGSIERLNYGTSRQLRIGRFHTDQDDMVLLRDFFEYAKTGSPFTFIKDSTNTDLFFWQCQSLLTNNGHQGTFTRNAYGYQTDQINSSIIKVLNRLPVNTPRFYSEGLRLSSYGNGVAYPHDLTGTGWSQSGSITRSYLDTKVKAPDGTLGVSKAVVSGVGAYVTYTTGLVWNSDSYLFTVWLANRTSTDRDVTIYLRSASAGNVASSAVRVQPGDGWQRFEVTGTGIADSSNVECRIVFNDTDTFFVWGASVCQADQVNLIEPNYAPSTALSETNSAEYVDFKLSQIGYNLTSGTIGFKWYPDHSIDTFTGDFFKFIDSATGNIHLRAWYDNGSIKLSSYRDDASVRSTVSVASPTITPGNSHNIYFSWDHSNPYLYIYIDGDTNVDISTGFMPLTEIDVLRFGGSTNQGCMGVIADIFFFNGYDSSAVAQFAATRINERNVFRNLILRDAEFIDSAKASLTTREFELVCEQNGTY